MTTKQTRRPVLVVPKSVTVYAPATPLRAVQVLLDDVTGEVFQDEVAVLGIQVAVAERYGHRPVPLTEGDPRPRSFAAKDIIAEGYQPDFFGTEYLEHRVVIWDQEYGAVPLDGALLDPGDYIIAPVNHPRWDQLIAGRIAKLRAEKERSPA